MVELKKIAGIGHTNIPDSIFKEMVSIGEWCKENDIYVSSGHADGADYAFEHGAKDHCLIYLPWKNFNSNLVLLGPSVVITPDEELDEIVTLNHYKGKDITPGVRSLMRRNVCQILGKDLDNPVDAVVCYRIRPGGTDFSVKLAYANNIPVLNMAIAKYNTAEKIITELTKNFTF